MWTPYGTSTLFYSFVMVRILLLFKSLWMIDLACR